MIFSLSFSSFGSARADEVSLIITEIDRIIAECDAKIAADAARADSARKTEVQSIEIIRNWLADNCAAGNESADCAAIRRKLAVAESYEAVCGKLTGIFSVNMDSKAPAKFQMICTWGNIVNDKEKCERFNFREEISENLLDDYDKLAHWNTTESVCRHWTE